MFLEAPERPSPPATVLLEAIRLCRVECSTYTGIRCRSFLLILHRDALGQTFCPEVQDVFHPCISEETPKAPPRMAAPARETLHNENTGTATAWCMEPPERTFSEDYGARSVASYGCNARRHAVMVALMSVGAQSSWQAVGFKRRSRLDRARPCHRRF